MFKELKEYMKTIYHHIEDINKVIHFLKKKHMKILKLKCIIREMKIQ